jgi:hypothetical protein
MTKENYHGTLWFVQTDMIAESDERNCINGRKVLIERGEIIEFRFHSRMNFRTTDDKYFCVNEDTWLKHCVKIGTILERIRSQNIAKTKEILKLKLYDEVKEGMQLYRKYKEDDNN